LIPLNTQIHDRSLSGLVQALTSGWDKLVLWYQTSPGDGYQ
jgi:hypothetical protein